MPLIARYHVRQEPPDHFYEATPPSAHHRRIANRKEHFTYQIDEILNIIDRFPEVGKHLSEVDTVGDEKEMYRKEHFFELQHGFRKLQFRGFKPFHLCLSGTIIGTVALSQYRPRHLNLLPDGYARRHLL